MRKTASRNKPGQCCFALRRDEIFSASAVQYHHTVMSCVLPGLILGRLGGPPARRIGLRGSPSRNVNRVRGRYTCNGPKIRPCIRPARSVIGAGSRFVDVPRRSAGDFCQEKNYKGRECGVVHEIDMNNPHFCVCRKNEYEFCAALRQARGGEGACLVCPPLSAATERTAPWTINEWICEMQLRAAKNTLSL
jgi:hypothetical protein